MVAFIANFVDILLLFLGFYGCRKELLFGSMCGNILLVFCAFVALLHLGVFVVLSNRRPNPLSARKGFFLGHGIFVLSLLAWLVFLRIY